MRQYNTLLQQYNQYLHSEIINDNTDTDDTIHYIYTLKHIYICISCVFKTGCNVLNIYPTQFLIKKSYRNIHQRTF